jgi:cold shock protein
MDSHHLVIVGIFGMANTSDKNVKKVLTMNGKVKFFNDQKGFGFITGDDGKEYFAHMSSIAPGVKLHENDAVTFDVTEGDRGPKAANVKKV